MEVTAQNIDRLVTIEMRMGNRSDRGIIAPLYDCACKKLDGRPVSIVAAQRMINEIKAGDNVFLVTGFASYPRLICGETDGPLGLASLARAIRFGLGAVPIIVAGNNDMEPTLCAVKAAGLNVLEYSAARETPSAAVASITFPYTEIKDSKGFAADIMEQYSPKAVIAIEVAGPNVKGVKHFVNGVTPESVGKFPGLEYIFYEANKRKLLSIACIDQGNEIGSGTIEEDVRRITPHADVCRCPCGGGIACEVKTDIVFPAAVSNWGAYGISAMLAFLLKKPIILQDAETEQRMLEACIMAGACDGPSGQLIMKVDAISHRTNEAVVTMLHEIIKMSLSS